MRTMLNCLICVPLNHFKTAHFFLITHDSLKHCKTDWPTPWISPAWEVNSCSVFQKFPPPSHNMKSHDMFTKDHAGLCSEENQSSLICPPNFLNMLLNITVAAKPHFNYKTVSCNSTKRSDWCYSNLLLVRARAFKFNVLQFISGFYTPYL